MSEGAALAASIAAAHSPDPEIASAGEVLGDAIVTALTTQQKQHPQLQLPKQPRAGAHHLGRIIVDAILQERSTYDPVRRPFAEQRLATDPENGRLFGFLEAIRIEDVDGVPRATRRRFSQFRQVAEALGYSGVNTSDDLRAHLADPQLRHELHARLWQVDMMEQKTMDMLEVLAGDADAAVIDGRVRKVLASLGIESSDYAVARRGIVVAAQRLGWTVAQVDATLWHLGNQDWQPRYGGAE